MTDVPLKPAGAAPDTVEDPTLAAERIVADASRQGSPEWLAAKQLLTERNREAAAPFSDLEKEMQALKGMSEI